MEGTYWVILHAFLSSADFFKKVLLELVSSSLNADQDWYSVCPDLGPNCLQRLSADDKITASKEIVIKGTLLTLLNLKVYKTWPSYRSPFFITSMLLYFKDFEILKILIYKKCICQCTRGGGSKGTADLQKHLANLLSDMLVIGCFISFLAFGEILSSADDICKQFGSRSGPTQGRAWSGSKLLDTLMLFPKKYFETKKSLKISADDKKDHEKLHSMQI